MLFDLDLPQLDVEPWVRPAVVGAVAILPLAACSASETVASSGDTVTRAATGDLSATGGARRFHGDQTAIIVEYDQPGQVETLSYRQLQQQVAEQEAAAARAAAAAPAGATLTLTEVPVRLYQQ